MKLSACLKRRLAWSQIITWGFVIWTGLIFLGALNDTNFNPVGLTSLILTSLGTGFIFGFVIWRFQLGALIKRYRWFLTVVAVGIALIWQLLVVTQVSAPIGFSAGELQRSLLNPAVGQHLLARNPSNFFPTYLQHWLLVQFHLAPSWVNLNLINLSFFDFSLLLNLINVFLLNRSALMPLIWVQSGLMVTMIQVIVPGADIMVLPFVSLLMLGFVINRTLGRDGRLNGWQLLGTLGFSLGALGTWLLKPSALVLLVAIAGWSLMKFWTSSKKWSVIKTGLFKGLVFLLIVTSGGVVANQVKQHNDFIQITDQQELPLSHSLALGLTAPGGSNVNQTKKMRQLATKSERNKYAEKIIFHQLRNYGMVGLGQYFVTKNYHNTSDGTFGWYRGDHPYISKRPQHKLQQLYYRTGTHFHDYQFLAQLFWVACLGLLILGFRVTGSTVQVLRLAWMLGLTVLLLFEGGRSRLLIQFLPELLLLLGLTYQAAWQKLMRLAHVFVTK
ncbi:integral membrane protein [Fructilactobacillus florum 8D]|uniref:Integral membrane protein n=1 Tax=Fructilactobacillus florum 8D TaxID=1221538 RepID=W9EFT9_9LACO|nr:hypothetical protein [Fructilactobacillus florum]ETO40998.1 integral membrane protein [Fructilactobacillus florum 8D]